MKSLITSLVSAAAIAFTVLAGPRTFVRADQMPQASHISWVETVMGRMETIKVGMTRNDLLKVFTIEGGPSSAFQRTFVSRECPYFKVDVEFEAVGRPSRNAVGRVTLAEDPADRIVKISRPYLQRVNLD